MLRTEVKAECFCLYYLGCTLKKVLALTPLTAITALTPYYLLAGNTATSAKEVRGVSAARRS